MSGSFLFLSSLLFIFSTQLTSTLLTCKTRRALLRKGFAEWFGDQSSHGGNRDGTNNTWYTGPGCGLDSISSHAGVPKIHLRPMSPVWETC